MAQDPACNITSRLHVLFLARVRRLTSLDLSNTSLDGSGIEEGLSHVLQGTRLEVLDLSRNRCDADAVKVLLQAGSALSSLRCLRLNENKPGIGDEGFRAIVHALSTDLGNLEELEVRGPGYAEESPRPPGDGCCSAFVTGRRTRAIAVWHCCLIPWPLVFTRKEWSADGYSILTNDGAEALLRQSRTDRLTLLDLSGQNDIGTALRTQLDSEINGRTFFGKSAFYQHACNGSNFLFLSSCLSVMMWIMIFLLISPPVMVSLDAYETVPDGIVYMPMYMLGLPLLLFIGSSSFGTMCPWPCCWRSGPYEINPHLRSLFPRLRPRQPVAVAGNDENSGGVELAV